MAQTKKQFQAPSLIDIRSATTQALEHEKAQTQIHQLLINKHVVDALQSIENLYQSLNPNDTVALSVRDTKFLVQHSLESLINEVTASWTSKEQILAKLLSACQGAEVEAMLRFEFSSQWITAPGEPAKNVIQALHTNSAIAVGSIDGISADFIDPFTNTHTTMVYDTEPAATAKTSPAPRKNAKASTKTAPGISVASGKSTSSKLATIEEMNLGEDDGDNKIGGYDSNNYDDDEGDGFIETIRAEDAS